MQLLTDRLTALLAGGEQAPRRLNVRTIIKGFLVTFDVEVRVTVAAVTAHFCG